MFEKKTEKIDEHVSDYAMCVNVLSSVIMCNTNLEEES